MELRSNPVEASVWFPGWHAFVSRFSADVPKTCLAMPFEPIKPGWVYCAALNRAVSTRLREEKAAVGDCI